MKYKYLYQDKSNRNCEGEIKARDRNDAYRLLRQEGVRPYRLIGDDPFRWQPLAIAVGYAVLLTAIIVLSVLLGAHLSEGQSRIAASPLSDDEATELRLRAEEVVYQAPKTFRYNVWKGVNARLVERGLEPLPLPDGLVEEDL